MAGFTWSQSIADGGSATNVAIAEIVTNITQMETWQAIPAGSQQTFPANEEPWAMEGESIMKSSMDNIKGAIDKIHTWQTSTGTCKLYCTTVNTAYKSAHYATYKASDKAIVCGTDYISEFSGEYGTYNSGNDSPAGCLTN